MHIYTNTIDKETKNKALFVIKAKGKTLSELVREIIKKNASEFEKYIGG